MPRFSCPNPLTNILIRERDKGTRGGGGGDWVGLTKGGGILFPYRIEPILNRSRKAYWFECTIFYIKSSGGGGGGVQGRASVSEYETLSVTSYILII